MNVDLAVIGAGTAGLSAFKEALKFSDKVVLIDHGPLGTTCARVGCMPSKVLIQVADDYFRRHLFAERGILGSDALTVDRKQVMNYVRSLRDGWVNGVIDGMDGFKDKLINGEAKFIEPYVLEVNGQQIHAKNIVIATGSSSIIPEGLSEYNKQLLCSDVIFEQEDFQNNIAVIGLGVIGIELGQALSRLGINIMGITRSEFIGGLSDPTVAKVAVEIMRQEFPLHLKKTATLTASGKQISLAEDIDFLADQVLLSIGRQPNVENLNLDVFGFELGARGVPKHISPQTLQVKGHRIFIPGDVNGVKPLLHEAADEGRIAGFNAVHENTDSFQRRCPLAITFCHPNIAVVGQSYREIHDQDIITGTADFSNQGRSRILGENKGVMHVYARKDDGKVLGAEMIAPEGEHMAHLLAWAIQQELNVFQILRKPYYHPSVEEGLRKALRELSHQVTQQPKHIEIAACDSAAVDALE